MAGSRRWITLNKEIAALRDQFLPQPFDPLGVYPDSARVLANARAFLVLSHAEIESYLEEWAKEIARASEEKWRLGEKVTPPLAFLFATMIEQIRMPARDAPVALKKSCEKMFQAYYKTIKDNHGIKEDNILTLFSPLGVPASAMGVTLLPNLNSFGELRGAHAHHSVKAVENTLDPETEYSKVTIILSDLLTLDGWLANYKRRIR